MVRLTDRPDMTLDVYRGRKTTIQQQQHMVITVHETNFEFNSFFFAYVSFKIRCRKHDVMQIRALERFQYFKLRKFFVQSRVS